MVSLKILFTTADGRERAKGNKEKENVSTYFKVKNFEPKQEGELEAVEGFTRIFGEDLNRFLYARKLLHKFLRRLWKFSHISLSMWSIFRSIKMSHTHGCMITDEECVNFFSMLNDARVIYYIHGICYGELPLLLYFLYFVQIMSTRNNNRNASHSLAHANFQFV